MENVCQGCPAEVWSCRGITECRVRGDVPVWNNSPCPDKKKLKWHEFVHKMAKLRAAMRKEAACA